MLPWALDQQQTFLVMPLLNEPYAIVPADHSLHYVLRYKDLKYLDV